MLPDRVSNPGPLTYESGALPIALRSPAQICTDLHRRLSHIQQRFRRTLSYLSQVFDRFRKANLKLKPSKCHFAAKEVKYLGHRFTQEGIGVDTEKTAAVVDFPTPKNQTDVRAFLGLSGYYRRFIQGYAEIARPLNQLLRKDSKWQWTDQCEAAFKKLKKKVDFPTYSCIS